MPTKNYCVSALVPLLDGSSAAELIAELVRNGLQDLIELELAALLGTDRHELSEVRLGFRDGNRARYQGLLEVILRATTPLASSPAA